jgi:integrase
MPKPTSLLKGFEKTVATVQTNPDKRQVIFDESTTGLALIVSPKGKKSYSIVARDPAGKQVWKSIGEPGSMSIEDARAKARIGVERIKAGEQEVLPGEKPRKAPDTFRTVCELFLKRHVDKKALRMAKEVRRTFDVYVLPEWGDQPFTEVRRRAVADLLDKIQDRQAGPTGDMGGPTQADHTLSYLSMLFSWYQARDEDYVSPIVRGMRRTDPKARARVRVIGQNAKGEIDDDELRLFWHVAGAAGQYGAFLKLCLLTGQRKDKVRTMRRDEIVGGVWTIATEAREKNNAGLLDLPKAALTIIDEQPEVKGNGYVFAGRDKAPIWPGAKLKASFDAELTKANGDKPLTPWVVHDLRRTAKTLMRRARVDSEISERVLGHAIEGVEGTYDRFAYRQEKRQALVALAKLIDRIVNRRSDNVVQIAEAVA